MANFIRGKFFLIFTNKNWRKKCLMNKLKFILTSKQNIKKCPNLDQKKAPK